MGNMMSMGAGHSALGEAGDVAEYVARLSDAEIKRYTDGYRRICRIAGSPSPSSGNSAAAADASSPSFVPQRSSSSVSTGSSSDLTVAGSNAQAVTAASQGGAVSKKQFRNKVLGAFTMIPHSLSDRLFEVLDAEHSGELSLANVLSGLAWLKHGSYDEQVQLLFIIYDLDSAGEISREVLDRFMDVIYGRKRARHATTVTFLDRVFDGRSTLELQEFRQVVQEKDARGDALLVKWLSVLAAKIGIEDDPQILALEKTYNPVAIRRRIAQATLFTLTEVTALERQFLKMFDPKGGASTRIPSAQFVDVLGARGVFPSKLLERFCISTALPDLVLFDEFCQFLSDFCRGDSRDVKVRHLFRIYSDRSTTDRVDLSAMKELIHVGVNCGSSDAEQEEERHVAEISATQTAEGGWDEDTFAQWAAGAVAVQQVLDQLAFAACIIFNVKPESAYLEKCIVEWHWQEATQAFAVGHSWNLVGAEWWRKWCDYVGMDPRNGTPYGSLALPQIPPDTTVEAARNIRGNIALRAANLNGKAVGSRTIRPGPIANWSLLMQSGCRRLKEKLVLARDFYMIPASGYAVLFSWYSGGPDLARYIVEVPTKTGYELQIELFPLVLRVARVDPANGGVIRSGEEILLSELSTPTSLLEATCRALQLQKLIDKARLWYFNEKFPDHKIRLRDKYPLELKKLTQDSVFLLEVQDDDGSWPLSQTSDTITSSPSNSGDHRPTRSDERVDEDDETGTPQRKRPREHHRPSLRTSDICSRGNLGEALASHSAAGSDVGSPTVEVDSVVASPIVRKRFSKDAFKGQGLVGLDNLGNTCYMSSALQCLSHTRLLVEYFKNEAYLKDINLRNRDGTNGKLTVAFGELLRVLWTSDRKRFAPTAFKKVLARCNPQFVGSDQHDAQELLACLLSSLSEDLNRVMTKPYTVQPDSDGRSDALVAEEWWQNHQKREFSVIVALFTGQYKSLLECSICQYESARFEPFTFLQLSLPESNYRSLVLTIIFRTDRVPLRFSVRVRNGDTVQQMKEQVAEFLNTVGDDRSALKVIEDDVESTQDSVADDDWTKVVIARISTLHTVEVLLDDRLPLNQIHERDQLTAFQLDRAEDLLPPPLAAPNGIRDEADKASKDTDGPASLSNTAAHDTNEETGDQDAPSEEDQGTANVNPTNGVNHNNGEAEDTAVKQSSVAATEEDDEAEEEDDDEILPLGVSVFVRIDKTKDVVAARVIGSSASNGTINVAYPSGIRRYHIPLSKVIERRRDEAFIFLVHRRVERSTDSFTNAHITRLFGAPLVMRVSLRATTAYNLYMLVWNRLRRIFNWQQPPPPSDLDDTMQNQQRIRTDTSSLALGEHLPRTKFGFCLRLVTSHGIGCSRCEWLDGCLGCVLMPSAQTVIPLAAEETVAIDWDIRTLKEEYDPIQASKLDFHASVQQHQRQDNQPLNLAHCMEMFTAKETIPEAYCGHCKTLRPATKKMDLWRLPPLLVIQLKRFCFTQVSRRKLHHLVDFPLKGLQLDDFVAQQREPRRGRQSGLDYWLFLGGKLKQAPVDELSPSSSESGTSRHANAEPVRRDSTSALNAPATATATVRADDGFLYDLYAVVNHVGALGGGHYFAYVLSDHDGKWKCFNDHQCKDIDEKEVVSSMAYILFYRRRDTAGVAIEQLFPPLALDANGNGAGSEEEAASDKAQVEELLEQSKLPTGGNASNCIVS